MTNARWVAITYFLLAVLTGLFLEHVLGSIWAAVGWNDIPIVGDAWTLTTFIGFGISFGATILIVMNRTARTVSLEVVQEMRRVTWPSRHDTQSSTIAVLVTTVILALLLGGMDMGWASLSKIIYEAPRYLG